MSAALKLLCFLCILAVSTVSTQELADEGELKFVMLITRHGARSPSIEMPPNATIINDPWKIPFGKLIS